jgi:hypothetical protein
VSPAVRPQSPYFTEDRTGSRVSPNIQTNNEDVWLTFADDERLDDQKGRSETVDHQQSARLRGWSLVFTLLNVAGGRQY